MRSQWATRLHMPTESGSEPDTRLVLAPLTEREHPTACWALEEVGAAIRRFSGSADTAGLVGLCRLREVLMVALVDYESADRGLRWHWSRLRRRRHRLGALLARCGVQPDGPWTLPRSLADS